MGVLVMIGSLGHTAISLAGGLPSRKRELPGSLLKGTICAFVVSTLNQAHPFKGFSTVCQLREHMELLRSHVFGNPRSTNPASQAMTSLVEHVHTYVLDYFNASPMTMRLSSQPMPRVRLSS
jgi:hypothetical protein